jgi:hypothetical protein
MIFSFTTFVHVLDSQGNAVAQSDVQPGQGQWPTTGWSRTEWITDRVPVTLPPDVAAGDYQVLVGWYQLETGRRLPLVGDVPRDSVNLGQITISR